MCSWKTFGDIRAEAAHFGAGLRALGVHPMPRDMAVSVVRDFTPIKGPHCIVIFEETCQEWTTACVGCFGQSITVATSYSTLGMAAVAEAINSTSSPVILCNYRDVARVAKQAETECPGLTTIVYTRNGVEPELPEHPATMNAVQVVSYAGVLALGKASPCPFAEPSPQHVGLIMFTSGSTGKPKGVMLKQSSIVAAVAGLEDFFCDQVIG
jgi:long-chain acyl-CoA synthetase